jgi:competence protein ComFC
MRIGPSSITSRILDLVFPRSDIWSNDPLEQSNLGKTYLSEQTRRHINYIGDVVCQKCGSPIYGEAESSADCEHCRDNSTDYLSGNRSLFVLNDFSKKLIYEFKYHGGIFMDKDIERCLLRSEWLPRWINERVLVPVPLHRSRELERGYNQSMVLCEILMKAFPEIGAIQDCLVRKRKTETQTAMARSARIRNVMGVFDIKKVKQLNIQPIMLVDDVYTTGSTLNECARVLSAHGFNDIRSFTLGHG